MSRAAHLTFTRLAGASMVGVLLVEAAPAVDPLAADPFAEVDDCMRQEVAAESGSMRDDAAAAIAVARAVYDLAAPGSPTLVGSVSLDDTIYDMYVHGDIVYKVTMSGHMFGIRLSTPTAPSSPAP